MFGYHCALYINKLKNGIMSKLKATTLLLFVTLLGGVSFAQAQDKISDAELNKY